MTLQLEARNADLPAIVKMLTEQRVRRLDLVTSASALSARDGSLFIEDGPAAQVVTEDGVTSAAGLYLPTRTADDGIGQKLSVPASFLKQLRTEGRTDLYDALVNGRLHGLVRFDGVEGVEPEIVHPPMDSKFLLRLLKGDEGEPGVARAFLSPKYRIMDNLDVLLAVIDGINQAGVNAVPTQADLTDSRLYARFEAPQVAALAPNLLKGYRSPFEGPGAVQRFGDNGLGMVLHPERGHGNWGVEQALQAAAREGRGYPEGQEPVVWAGFVVSNSDVGAGARTISPLIRVQVCRNGLVLPFAADRKVHLGTEQAEGVVNWSSETQEKELALITAQARDAVATYLSQEFLDEQVARIEKLAGAPVAKPEVSIRAAARDAGFTQAEAEGILDHFLRGGLYTAGGAANAVTSFSQTVESADRAHELDSKAVRVMEKLAA